MEVIFDMKYKILLLLLLFSVFVFAEPALKVGDVAPDFTVKNPEGREVSLYSLKGKIILLDFWASWCGPCRIANKELIKIYKEFREKGVEIFSVSLDSQKDNWVKAIEKDKLNWQYHGTDFKEWESTPAQLYSIVALPTTFLINDDGTIVAKSHDLVEIGLSLNELIYKNAKPFPSFTSEKLYLPEKMKYEIVSDDKNVNLKGKEEVIDVTSLQEGNYKLKLEHQTFSFKKVDALSPEVTVDTIAYSVKNSPHQSFQVYNQRGKLIKEGTGTIDLGTADFPPNKYFINIGGKIYALEKKSPILN